MVGFFTAWCMAFIGLLQGCAHANDAIGLTLLFTNQGPFSLGVHRFDPDGQRGPVPGALGVGGSKQMTFMAGDSKRGVPKFVEVEWFISTPEYRAGFVEYKRNFPPVSGPISSDEIARRQAAREKIESLGKTYTRRIDLAPILTPELLAQVRSSSASRLKLTVIFKGEDVSITAAAEVRGK